MFEIEDNIEEFYQINLSQANLECHSFFVVPLASSHIYLLSIKLLLANFVHHHLKLSPLLHISSLSPIIKDLYDELSIFSSLYHLHA